MMSVVARGNGIWMHARVVAGGSRAGGGQTAWEIGQSRSSSMPPWSRSGFTAGKGGSIISAASCGPRAATSSCRTFACVVTGTRGVNATHERLKDFFTQTYSHNTRLHHNGRSIQPILGCFTASHIQLGGATSVDRPQGPRPSRPARRCCNMADPKSA